MHAKVADDLAAGERPVGSSIPAEAIFER